MPPKKNIDFFLSVFSSTARQSNLKGEGGGGCQVGILILEMSSSLYGNTMVPIIE